jgi:pyridoxine 5-phosphate synthase
MLLSVNVNYLANLRNAIGGAEPDLLKCARFCEHAGADSINAHLGDNTACVCFSDVRALKKHLRTKFVLKMAMSKEHQALALEILPHTICIVPESDEASPSFGVNVLKNSRAINEFIVPLIYKGVYASIFINPELDQVTAAYKAGAHLVELNTRDFVEAFKIGEEEKEYTKLKECAVLAKTLGMKVSLGKGINYSNVIKLCALPGITELSIGHSIITKSLFDGLDSAIKQMKELMNEK